ncbi:MAG: phosphopyruvate hydratase [Acidilobaceae archaeon]
MGVFEIASVRGLLALDSRGSPTVKAVVATRGGAVGWAIAPSGASRGSGEAVELRDGGRRWAGRGVSIALARLNEVVAPRLVGVDARSQALVDAMLVALDGTEDKSRLGGNVTTAVSLAVARAAAAQLGLPLYRYLGGVSARVLPTPLMNVINGGVHAGNELSFQEFLIAPVNADSFTEALRVAVEVYWELKRLLRERYGASAVNVGDEGGFAPPMRRVEEALEALVEAVRRSGYSEGSDVLLGVDAAASQLRESGGYRVDGRLLGRGELVELYAGLASRYPIAYIEDPLAEDDFEGFAELARRLGGRALVCGDDLYVTRVDRLKKGLEAGSTTAALLKVNQVGTLTEALEYAHLAESSQLKVVVSHRSGDTEDPFIADLAVALRAPLIKTGAPARGERTAKYNRLIEIEEELGPQARYAGVSAFKR